MAARRAPRLGAAIRSYRPRVHAWFVNVTERNIIEFNPEEPIADGQWVALSTFHWRPPDYPIPESFPCNCLHIPSWAFCWQQYLRSPPEIRKYSCQLRRSSKWLIEHMPCTRALILNFSTSYMTPWQEDWINIDSSTNKSRSWCKCGFLRYFSDVCFSLIYYYLIV